MLSALIATGAAATFWLAGLVNGGLDVSLSAHSWLDIAGIVLNRFGHAFINPQPGFFFGLDGQPAARDALRNGPFGRIAFSHSDLAGAMDHRNAFLESKRAVNQLLDQVLT